MARPGRADGRADGDAPSGGAERNGASAPITVRLDDILADRGMTLTELAQRVGITIVNLSILKNGRARAIRFTTLASLCEVLSCQPGDLLSYRPDCHPRDGAGSTPPQ